MNVNYIFIFFTKIYDFYGYPIYEFFVHNIYAKINILNNKGMKIIKLNKF